MHHSVETLEGALELELCSDIGSTLQMNEFGEAQEPALMEVHIGAVAADTAASKQRVPFTADPAIDFVEILDGDGFVGVGHFEQIEHFEAVLDLTTIRRVEQFEQERLSGRQLGHLVAICIRDRVHFMQYVVVLGAVTVMGVASSSLPTRTSLVGTLIMDGTVTNAVVSCILVSHRLITAI